MVIGWIFGIMEIRRLLIITIMILLLLLFAYQYFVFQYTKTLSLSFGDKASTFMAVQDVCHLSNSGLCRFDKIDRGINSLDTKENFDYDTDKKVREEAVDLASENLNKESFNEKGKTVYESLMLENINQTEDNVMRKSNADVSYSPLMKGDVAEDSNIGADEAKATSSQGISQIGNQITVISNQSKGTTDNSVKKVVQAYSDVSVTPNDASSGEVEDIKSRTEELEKNSRIELVNKDSVVLSDRMVGPDVSTLSGPFISISQMYSKLSRAHKSSCLKVWITFRGSTFE